MRIELVIATPAAASAVLRASTAATAASAFAHRTRFVDYQRAAQKILAIAILHGAVCLIVVTELGKPEASGIAGELVADDLYGIGVKAGPREPILKLCFASLVGKVAYKQFFQGHSFGPIHWQVVDCGLTPIRQARFHPLTMHPKFGTD